MRGGPQKEIKASANNSIISKPVIVNIQEEYDSESLGSYFVISVKTQKENKNQMRLVLENINNKQIITTIELNTKNGIMELLLDE